MTTYRVSATFKGETVYLSTETDLNWRKVLVPTIEPVAMSRRAAESVAAFAGRDESMSDVQIEEN